MGTETLGDLCVRYNVSNSLTLRDVQKLYASDPEKCRQFLREAIALSKEKKDRSKVWMLELYKSILKI